MGNMDAISVSTGRRGNLSAVTDTESTCVLRKKVEGRKLLKKKLKVKTNMLCIYKCFHLD